MDFVDWRKASAQNDAHKETAPQSAKYRGRGISNYVEEMLHEAEARGDFANLPGQGKPLPLEDMAAAGDKAMAYRLLKGNNFAPPEIELAKDIDAERARAEAKLTRLRHQSKTLCTRRLTPFNYEQRAFNASVEKAAQEYEQALRDINSKILTLNITAPALLHRPMLNVAQLVVQLRESCPLFPLE